MTTTSMSRFISILKTTNLLKPIIFRTSSSVKELTPNIEPLTVSESDKDDELYERLLVECKGNEPAVLQSYEKFMKMTAKEFDLKLVSIETPPKIFERWTVLKSAHVHKKHRVQYETRTHFKNFEFKYITGSTADTLLEYIQRNLPEGVAMKVSKEQIFKIPTNFQSLKQKAIEKSYNYKQESS